MSLLVAIIYIMAELDHFSAKYILTPVTTNYPRLTFDPITQLEGFKLTNMYEFYGHAMQHGIVIAFLSENDLLTPVTPNDLTMIDM